MNKNSILLIECKDCNESFMYSYEAICNDKKSGRTPPERCPKCREKHCKEYNALGISHYDVLQIRNNGTGGLASLKRARQKQEILTTRLDRKPFRIEEIIGSIDQPDTLLHGLFKDPRRIHLIVGPTGSGKSTWLPYRLLTCEELTKQGPILVTQPRIPATKGPAEFVAKLYYGETIEDPIGPGLAVGYRYSEIGDAMRDYANRLLFVTDGTLLNWIKKGEIRQYSVIMIDEAHERSDRIDKILTLLKYKLSHFPNLQIIIASATVDANSFIQFFGGLEKVAPYESTGFTYPILEVYSDESVADYPNIWEDKNARNEIWEILKPEIIQNELLGKEPCWRFKALEEFKLRYYPLFETLVFTGEMGDDDKKILKEEIDSDTWSTVIDELYLSSHRLRSIGENENIPITKPIYKIKKKPEIGIPTIINGSIKNKYVYATVDSILQLVKRDDEAFERRKRIWKQREKLGWPDLIEPFDLGHILAFLPTSTTINECAELVSNALVKKNLQNKNIVLRVYRNAPEEEKKSAISRERLPGIRKILIGSNLAETSLTFHDLVYVIDSGLICEEYYSPSKGKDRPTVLHSRAGCRQRVGRVGREEPGEAYQLYTRECISKHIPFTTPEVMRSNAEDLLLDLIYAGIPYEKIKSDAEVKGGLLMNPPDQSEITRSFNELERFEAVDEDGDLTPAGEELAQTIGDTLLNKKLLSEADRFGVLFEMAVFLSLISLKDTASPPLISIKPKNIKFPNKWLGIWDANEQPLYDDLEEEYDEDNRWDNPYLLANTLLKRSSVVKKSLDDLELYLRLWQGWYFSKDEESRKKWAKKYGVNHEAFLKVEEKLGLSTGDEQGVLHNYWAISQKGKIDRDVLFAKLDFVRYLYSAGYPEHMFSRQGQSGRFDRIKNTIDTRPAFLHPESTWQPTYMYKSLWFGKEVSRHFCVATQRQIGRCLFLRHITWIHEDWIKDELPTFKRSPVEMAYRFSKYADQVKAFLGEQPFCIGTQKAGFPEDMPEILIPSQSELDQWKVQYQSAIDQKEILNAKIADVIYYPHICSIRMVFIKIHEGPLLPLDVRERDNNQYNKNDNIKVRLKYQQPLIWAIPYSEGEIKAAPKNEKTNISKETCAIIPRKKTVEARIQEVIIGKSFRGFSALVTSGNYHNTVIYIPLHLSEKILRKECIANRSLIAIKESHKNQKQICRLIKWSDGKRIPDISDDWPIFTVLDVDVTDVDNERPYLVKVNVKGVCSEKYEWYAFVGDKNVKEAVSRGRMRVYVTKWNYGTTSLWPFLKFKEWID